MRCTIVPPHLLERLTQHGDPHVRLAAARTLDDARVRRPHHPPPLPTPAARVEKLHRLVYSALGLELLPGVLVRTEDEASDDDDAERAFAAAGTTHAFFKQLFRRNSLDGRGMHLIGTVHYGTHYDNAFWNGRQMVYGDGDGEVFTLFTTCIDVIAHELSHGMVASEVDLVAEGESGALSESLADVFGSLVKQWSRNETVEEADWLIGCGQFTAKVRGAALRSLAKPGTAYDDPVLGRDPQVAHVWHYVDASDPAVAAHINSGIPNHAFYLFARAIGGRAWETAAHVWYAALRSGLPPNLHLRALRARHARRNSASPWRSCDEGAQRRLARRRPRCRAWAAPGGRRRDRPMSVGRIAEAERNVREGTIRRHCLELLSDGKARTTIEIVKELRDAHLATSGLNTQNLYNNLLAYIEQEAYRGRKPQIAVDEGLRVFRLNQPVDDWPEVTLAPRPRYATREHIEALAHRLEKASLGNDATGFEIAVCDAFAAMGFIADHVGGRGRPDGVLTAALGPLAYRVVLECKSSAGFVHDGGPDEVARFRDALGAEYGVVVGRKFNEDRGFLSELSAHRVTCWTIADVIEALRLDLDPYECRGFLTPGLVDVALRDLAWTRLHGPEKRAIVVRETLRREGHAAQVALAHTPASEAPALTLDAALLLVETALMRVGATASPTREEVAEAMHDLVRADVAAAVPGRDAIVIRRP